jgi:biotin synthase
MTPTAIQRDEVLAWLLEQDEQRLEELWRRADAVRRQTVGDEVHLRGLVELSNRCVRRCAYCGLAHGRRESYQMSADEVLGCARKAVELGYGTLVLQAGEHPGLDAEWMAGLVRRVKEQTALAVTLSLGERSREELLLWRQAGADRYLLRFETSDRALYRRIHPSLPGRCSDRIALLAVLRELGYEVGSGVMVGIPGQNYEMLAGDLLTFRRLDLDMIGLGPYIPHPDTPLGRHADAICCRNTGQAPNTEAMTYKCLALARLLCPAANIPSTTALATLNRADGRELGLQRGANVVMPNLTPPEYRALYEVYPNKACVYETADAFHAGLRARIERIGRTIARGRGDSANYRRRTSCVAAQT